MKGQDPLLPQPTPDAPRIAAALQQAMTKSGLFYESHVAEWAQGQRAMTDLSSEPQMVQARAGTPFVATEPATAQFISLQLSSQEQGQVAWHGQLWPGQPMQWQIQKDAPKREHQADGEEASTWQSRLRLRFAQLGELDARIVLDRAPVSRGARYGHMAIMPYPAHLSRARWPAPARAPARRQRGRARAPGRTRLAPAGGAGSGRYAVGIAGDTLDGKSR